MGINVTNVQVKYYETTQFSHGVKLTLPVNPEVAAEYAAKRFVCRVCGICWRECDSCSASGEISSEYVPSEYVETTSIYVGDAPITEQTLYRAHTAYDGSLNDGSISFAAGQEIIVVDKSESAPLSHSHSTNVICYFRQSLVWLFGGSVAVDKRLVPG